MGRALEAELAVVEHTADPAPRLERRVTDGEISSLPHGHHRLTTTAGVMPGEDFTLIWAIFDLSDEVLDSVVILDNFAWNCEGGPPQTIPG